MYEYNEKIVNEFRSDVPLLTEAGFIAMQQVDEMSALNCFCAAMIANPHEPLPMLGVGMVHLFKLELDEANKIFDTVLAKYPDNETAKALKGISGMFSLNEESMKDSEKVLKDLMKHTKDPLVKQLGAYTEKLREEIKSKMKDLHPLEMGKKSSSPLDRLKK